MTEEMFVSSNYSDIFDGISKPAREKADIQFSTTVVSVQTPEDRSSGKQVIVATQDGRRLVFDEVVMTAPLGWLQKHGECFQPPLPARLHSAIHNLKLSQLEKVFIMFPSAFWISDTTTDSFPSYTNWLSLEYALDTNPER